MLERIWVFLLGISGAFSLTLTGGGRTRKRRDRRCPSWTHNCLPPSERVRAGDEIGGFRAVLRAGGIARATTSTASTDARASSLDGRRHELQHAASPHRLANRCKKCTDEEIKKR